MEGQTIPRAIFFLLWFSLSAWALDITTLDGTVYKSCQVTRVEPDGLTITYPDGVAKIRFIDLPVSLQQEYHYDPLAAARYSNSVADAREAENQREEQASPGVGSSAAMDREFDTDDGFSVRLPNDWQQVPADILKQLNVKMSELSTLPQSWQYAYQPKLSAHWLAYPYILIRVIPGRKSAAQFKMGFETETQTQEGIDEATKKASGLLSGLQVSDYSYDEKNLTAALLTTANIRGIGLVQGFTGLKLMESGVVQCSAYCTAATKNQYVPLFRDAFNNIQLSDSSIYRPGIFDSVPYLGSINWGGTQERVIIGGIVALVLGMILRAVKKRA